MGSLKRSSRPIVPAFFIAADATRMGERGIYVAPAVDNMIKTKRGLPTVENTCFKHVLKPVWGSTADFALLARSGSVFAGATAWPWNDMVWGWEGTTPMRGTVKAHVTPRTILNNLDKEQEPTKKDVEIMGSVLRDIGQNFNRH